MVGNSILEEETKEDREINFLMEKKDKAKQQQLVLVIFKRVQTEQAGSSYVSSAIVKDIVQRIVLIQEKRIVRL